MRKSIGIVGAGTAGLHLGLFLRQHGIEATIITDRRPEEYRRIGLLNTVGHNHETISRETNLGVNHWHDGSFGYYCHNVVIRGEPAIAFRGDYTLPSRAVDYRIYLPRLMEDFQERGGRIEYRQVEPDDVGNLSSRFDLIVVGTGKGVLGQMFRHDPTKLPFERPSHAQRALCAGIYTGVAPTLPRSVTFSVLPGSGEAMDFPMLTFDGLMTAIVIGNLPGSPLEDLVRLRYEENPRLFLDTVLRKLEKYHPAIFERVDPKQFDLARPVDLLQGGVVPTIRQTYAQFDNGTFAIAVGDVHSVIDPLTGQGGNMASYAALVLGEHIVREEIYDARFCELVDRERSDRILAAAAWTHSMLIPPTAELDLLFNTMAGNKSLADEFTENFNYPERQWNRLASPARIRAWIDERRVSTPLGATSPLLRQHSTDKQADSARVSGRA